MHKNESKFPSSNGYGGTKVDFMYEIVYEMDIRDFCTQNISEIQFMYEKINYFDILNGSMETVFQKIQKWGHLTAPEI